MNNEKRFISPLNFTRFAWLHRSFARSPDKSARYAGYASSAESTRGELLYKSHGDVCQKIIAPKDINMGVAQVFDP